jgi:hypothetical protein
LAGRCDYFCVRSQRGATLREFKGAAPENSVVDAAKATARLPNLDIEILHRRSPNGDSEQISIVLQAVPSFEAFGRFIEAATPLRFGPGPLGWPGPLARSDARRDALKNDRLATAAGQRGHR